jgi:hypothetical protein
MKRLSWIVMLSIGLAARGAGSAEAPVGQWKIVDERSGAVLSVVETYDQGGKALRQNRQPDQADRRAGQAEDLHPVHGR